MTKTSVVKEYLATSVVAAPVAYILAKYVLKVKPSEVGIATGALTLGYVQLTKTKK